MLKFGSWDLPGFDYFTSNNAFAGSKDQLRFKVCKKDTDFAVFVWSGEKCFEKAEIELEEHFPFEEASIYKINDFLSQAYKDRKIQN